MRMNELPKFSDVTAVWPYGRRRNANKHLDMQNRNRSLKIQHAELFFAAFDAE
jgi:hypothetical protein